MMEWKLSYYLHSYLKLGAQFLEAFQVLAQAGNGESGQGSEDQEEVAHKGGGDQLGRAKRGLEPLRDDREVKLWPTSQSGIYRRTSTRARRRQEIRRCWDGQPWDSVQHLPIKFGRGWGLHGFTLWWRSPVPRGLLLGTAPEQKWVPPNCREKFPEAPSPPWEGTAIRFWHFVGMGWRPQN